MSLISLSQIRRDINIPLVWRRECAVHSFGPYHIASTNWTAIPGMTRTVNLTEISHIRVFASVQYVVECAVASSFHVGITVTRNGVNHAFVPEHGAMFYIPGASSFWTFSVDYMVDWNDLAVGAHVFALWAVEDWQNARDRDIYDMTLMLDVCRA